MMKDERIRARRVATLAAACIALATRAAAAQDPPPPMVPSEAPDAPPPLPAPDAVPRPAEPPPPSAAPPPDSAPIEPPAVEPPAPVEPPALRESHRAGTAHTLKGHTFIPAVLIDSAFVETHLTLGAELGHTWEYGITLNDTNLTMINYGFGVTAEHLSAGLAVTDRFEVGLDATYASSLASDINTALYGSQSAWEVRPGLRIRALRSPSTGTQLGLHFYGDFSGGVRQSPQGVLTEIGNELPSLNNSNMAQSACLAAFDLSCALTAPGYNPQTTSQYSNRQLGGGATLSLAQAFSSLFGVQAALGLEVAGRSDYAPTQTTGSSVVTFHAGLAASLDFGPTVPLVLMGEYRFTFINETAAVTPTFDAGIGEVFTHAVSAGLYYTGRRDFVVGAILNATFTTSGVNGFDDDNPDDPQSTANPPVTTLSGQVSATYFF
jgi:hypothetical protein